MMAGSCFAFRSAMPYSPLKVNDTGELAYTLKGSGGPSLVFLHGVGGTRESFENQFEYFASSRQVLSVDLPSHGMSGRSSDHSVGGIARELGQLVANLGLTQSVIVGHSLGAMLCLELATQGNVDPLGIVLIDPPILFPEVVAKGLGEVYRFFEQSDSNEPIVEFARTRFFGVHSESALRDRILGELGEMEKSIFCDLFRAQAVYDAEAALAKIEIPGLLIHSTTPIDLLRFGDLAPTFKIVQLENVGHYSHIESPEEVNDLVQTFIADLGFRSN